MARLPPFLNKLSLLVETVDPKIAGWAPDGLSFEVLDVEAFRHMLKKFYKGNLDTFIRQLHFYGFTKYNSERNIRLAKIKKLPEAEQNNFKAEDLYEAQANAWSFSHEYFKRDHPELMKNITRFDGKKTKNVATKDELNDLRRQVVNLTDQVQTLSTELGKAMKLIEKFTSGEVVTPRGGSDNNIEAITSIEPIKSVKTDIFDDYKRNRNIMDDTDIEIELLDNFDLQAEDMELMLPADDLLTSNVNTIERMDVEINLANSLKRSISFDNENEQLPKKIAKTGNKEVDPENVSKVVMYLRAAISEASKMAEEKTKQKKSNALVKKDNSSDLLVPLALSLPQIQSVLCKLQQQHNNNEIIKPMYEQVTF